LTYSTDHECRGYSCKVPGCDVPGSIGKPAEVDERPPADVAALIDAAGLAEGRCAACGRLYFTRRTGPGSELCPPCDDPSLGGTPPLICCVCKAPEAQNEIIVMGEVFRVCGAICAFELGSRQAPLYRRCARCQRLHLCDPLDHPADADPLAQRLRANELAADPQKCRHCGGGSFTDGACDRCGEERRR
jgi:hypothetical protein